MLIWSLLSMIGFGIALRTIKSYESLHLFSENILQRIRIVSAILILSFNFILRDHIVALWIIQFVIFLSPLWLSGIVQTIREKIIQEDMVAILDSLIIYMRSGVSLRVAIEKSSHGLKPATGLLLKEFSTSLQYRNNRNSMTENSSIRIFFDEIAEVDQIAHKQVDRLKAMKRRLLTERNFRRKSRQATVQIKTQAWIMAAMYGLLLVYVSCEFGFWKNSSIIFFSSAIFLMGLFFVLNMGRNYQWKL